MTDQNMYVNQTHKICESLGKIQYFRHAYTSTMYENSYRNLTESSDVS